MTTTASTPSQQRGQLLQQGMDYGNGGGSFIHSYGSKTYIRPKLDDVLDAVAQAKFNEKKWVWIQDDQEGYVRGHVLNESENDKVEVEFEQGGVSILEIKQRMNQRTNHFERVNRLL
jgi:hypothetical protein